MYVLASQPLLMGRRHHRLCSFEDNKTDGLATGLSECHRQRRVLRPLQDTGMELKHHCELTPPSPPEVNYPEASSSLTNRPPLI